MLPGAPRIVEIMAIFDCDGNSMNANKLDNLKIDWRKTEGVSKNKQTNMWERGNGGLVSTYPWRDDSSIWKNGKVVKKVCKEGESEPSYERTHNECFFVGLLKELISGFKQQNSKK